LGGLLLPNDGHPEIIPGARSRHHSGLADHPGVGRRASLVAFSVSCCVPISVLIVFLLRFTEQQRENVRLVADMRQAQEVQQMLIPAKASCAPGFSVESVYQPAQEVGGDFFQVLPGDDGSLLIVIGDVSGKRLKAAMTVSAIVGALRGCTLRAPTEVLDWLTRVLLGQTGGFVTCCATLNCGGWHNEDRQCGSTSVLERRRITRSVGAAAGDHR
jgi:Stage II sporulation protein E (SpoIIE)